MNQPALEQATVGTLSQSTFNCTCPAVQSTQLARMDCLVWFDCAPCDFLLNMIVAIEHVLDSKVAN